ncbi:hypothetical protein ACUIJQ_03305 [Levilactobacillus hammesii]|uniref:Lipoprotein n=1 Tax=Levilactobacillus hammesii DSM 16381 TaxID=1423753 RepID=A0A0R1ULG8_9LACO|nr:hypothetical protein [Levilactobacillus hammesii]KRL94073.1 hypothetical protein FD28_GL000620 [Levilactobacillus hammesii DSM 16381]
MSKKYWWGVLATAALLTLTACGRQLHAVKVSYTDAGVVAVIKGDTSSDQPVTYKTAIAKGRVRVEHGQFRIAVPTSTRSTTITVKQGPRVFTRRLKAVSGLGTYRAVAKQYNQTLIVTSLPKAIQTKLQLAPNAAQQLQAQGQLKRAMAQAKRATKGSQWPTTVEGQAVVKTLAGSMHLNVQHGRLMSVTVALAPAVLKSARAQQQLVWQLGALAPALGADARRVGQQLQEALDQGNVKAQTIRDHGISFRTGTTLTTGYVFVAR